MVLTQNYHFETRRVITTTTNISLSCDKDQEKPNNFLNTSCVFSSNKCSGNDTCDAKRDLVAFYIEETRQNTVNIRCKEG